jgi:hypothetical protein
VRSHPAGFTIEPAALEARARVAQWVALLESSHGQQLNEKELLPDFLTDVFGQMLGYRGPAVRDATCRYTMSREKYAEVDGKFADAVLGDFTSDGEDPKPVAAVEGKGPRDPLDRPFAGRSRSAVEQAYGYAINLPCDCSSASRTAWRRCPVVCGWTCQGSRGTSPSANLRSDG